MNRILRHLALALVLFPAVAPAQQGVERWSQEIARFEAVDREDPYRLGGAVFVGSSSIRFWNTLEQDFPTIDPLNRGFGGSRISDVRYYLDQLVLKHEPRVVVLYAGENDIAAGVPPSQVFADYRAIVEQIHREFPDTRLVFVSIKPGPTRWNTVEQVREANALIMEHAARDPLVEYVDVFMPMLNEEGLPVGELFVEDGIHMNAQGYEIWTRLVDPYVRAYRRE